MKYSTLKTGVAVLFAATMLVSPSLVAAQTRPAPAPATTPAAPADSMKDHAMAPGGMEGHDMMKSGMEKGEMGMGMGMKGAGMAPDAAKKPCCGKMAGMKPGSKMGAAGHKPHAKAKSPDPMAKPATADPMKME